MVDLDDTLHGETIPADSLAPGPAGDFDDLQQVPRDHYDIGAEIARGGMGRIVAARDRRTGRPLVIKEVRADLMSSIDGADRDVMIRRFKREAMLTARLQHPAVVPVYEIGRFDDTPFIAMKRVDGTPLLDLLIEANDLRERMALLPAVIAVAEAIAYAHSEQVIHRDLKPANILVGSFGETVVIDWGLAKLLSESDELIDSLPPVPGDVETVAGAVFGTPSYMPPEQAAGAEVGPAADVYALGALLYHLLTGEAPYSEVSRDSTAEVIDAVRTRPPRPIAELAPEAPGDLVSLTDKAMARDAGDRYAAAELVAELRSFQAGQQVAAHDYSLWELISRWVGRHRALVVTAAALIVAGAGATGWFVAATIHARDRARQQHQRAMRRTFERGLSELEHGNRRDAIESLAEAYPYLDDPRVARTVAEALRAGRGFAGELARFGLPVDGVEIRDDGRRVAAIVDSRVHLISDRGDRLREVDAIAVFFAGDHMVTFTDDNRMEVWASETGEKLGERQLEGSYSGQVAHAGDALITTTGSGAVAMTLEPLGELFTLPDDMMTSGLAINADGTRFLTVALLTRILDRSGAELARLPEPSPIPMGALAPDASELVRAEPDGTRRYSADGTLLGAVPGSGIRWVDYSRDGKKLLYLNGPFSVCVWSIGDARPRCDFEDAQPEVAYSANLETLVVGRLNGDVVVRDGATGRVRRLLAASEMDRPSLGLTPDGRRLVTGSEDGSVRLWDIDGDSFDAVIENGALERVGGRALVLLAGARRLEVWDPDAPGEPIQTFEVGADARKYAALSGDRSTIAWAGATWDLASGKKIAAIAGWDDLEFFRLGPDGEVLIGRSQSDGQVYARSARTGEPLWSFDPVAAIGAAGGKRFPMVPRVGPRGELLLQSVGVDLLVDLRTGALRQVLRRDDMYAGYGARFLATGLVVSFDGKRIYISDVATGARQRVIHGTGHGMVVHPDGVRVLLPLRQTLQLLDTRTGESRTLASTGRDSPGGIAFSPDGTLLAVAGHDGEIDLYDVETLTWVGRRNAGRVDFVWFSRGGRLLATSAHRTFVFDLDVETRPPAEVAAEVARLLGKPR